MCLCDFNQMLPLMTLNRFDPPLLHLETSNRIRHDHQISHFPHHALLAVSGCLTLYFSAWLRVR